MWGNYLYKGCWLQCLQFNVTILVINRCWLRRVIVLTFGDRKGLGFSGCKVCMWEISCMEGVGCSGSKHCQLNMRLFNNK